MRTKAPTIAAMLVAVALRPAAGQQPAARGPGGPSLTLTTPAFADGGTIPEKYTQKDSSPVSPRLEWTNVPANTISFTLQLKNRRGWTGYMGPGAPAAGPEHHYTFELFALDKQLDLTPEATRDDVLKAIDGHILGKAVLIGRFHL